MSDEYWPTYEGRIKVVQNELLTYGGSIKPEQIVDALDEYRSQFAYKCHDSFCPKRRRSGRAVLDMAGFPSLEALEQHRVIDHKLHHLRDVRQAVTGYPWHECACGHNDGPNGDEDWNVEVPQSRREHLERVAQYHAKQ